MERLTDTPDFCPEDLKTIKKVSKAVLKDLRKKYSKQQLESVISSQDPDVNEATIQSFFRLASETTLLNLQRKLPPASGGQKRSRLWPSLWVYWPA